MILLLIVLVLLVIIFGRSGSKSHPQSAPPPPPADIRGDIARQIEAASQAEKDQAVKQGLLRALDIVRNGRVPGTVVAGKQIAPAKSANSMALAAEQVQPQTQAVQAIPQAVQRQSSAVTLLYVGAFLFISAMIIFIAAPVLGGAARTFLVALTALAFYGCGLWLFDAKKQLRAAGQTFVVIGMLILPLVGVAAYNLVLDKTNAYGVWFFTSVASAGAYLYALSKLRSPLMGYMSVLSALSLVESAVLTAGLPLYFISWTLTIFAIGLAVFSKLKNTWPEQKEPLHNSAQLLLPIALAAAGIQVPEYGWWQFSAALVLGALFYAYCAYENERGIDERSTFLVLSLLLALGVVPSTAVALGASMQASTIALLTATAVLATNAALVAGLLRQPLYRNSVAALGVIPFVGSLILASDNTIVLALLLWLVIAGSVAYVLRSAGWLLTFFLPILALPVALNVVKEPDLSSLTLALVYTAMGVISLGVRYLVSSRKQEVRAVISGFYVTALSVGWCFAVSKNIDLGAALLVFDMTLLAVASFIEKEPKVFGIAFSGLYVAIALGLVERQGQIGLILALLYTALSGAAYLLAEIVHESERAKLIQRLAVTGLFVAPLTSFFTESYTHNVQPILLVIAGLVTWYQAHKEKSIDAEAAAYITLGVAVSWLLLNLGVREVLAFSYLWTAIFALMYLWRKQASDQARTESFLLFALLAFTVPLGLQVLDEAGSFRGWLFVIQQIVVLIIGVGMKQDMMIKWGVVASVLAVIYQLRDLTFLLLGVLGLSVIGVAIWLLNREAKNEKPKE